MMRAKQTPPPPATIRRDVDAAGDHIWRTDSTNGNMISGSTEGYERRVDRERSIKLTLLALIHDYGIEGMAELGWVPAGSVPAARTVPFIDADPLGTIENDCYSLEDAEKMLGCLVIEFMVPNDELRSVLIMASIPPDIWSTLPLSGCVEKLAYALAHSHRDAAEVFTFEESLTAFEILSRGE